jgi:hypothetical protein
MTPDDRAVVLSVAAGIYCARIQAGEKTPSAEAVVGEAVALLGRVGQRFQGPKKRTNAQPPIYVERREG